MHMCCHLDRKHFYKPFRLLLYLCRQKVELKLEGHFLQRIVYEDDITYSLVGAASEVLGKSSLVHVVLFFLSCVHMSFDIFAITNASSYKDNDLDMSTTSISQTTNNLLLFLNRN